MPGPNSRPKPGKTQRKRLKIAGVPFRGRLKQDPAHKSSGEPLPYTKQ